MLRAAEHIAHGPKCRAIGVTSLSAATLCVCACVQMLGVRTLNGDPVVERAVVYDSQTYFWCDGEAEVSLNHDIQGDSSLTQALWLEREGEAEGEFTVCIRHTFEFDKEELRQ